MAKVERFFDDAYLALLRAMDYWVCYAHRDGLRLGGTSTDESEESQQFARCLAVLNRLREKTDRSPFDFNELKTNQLFSREDKAKGT